MIFPTRRIVYGGQWLRAVLAGCLLTMVLSLNAQLVTTGYEPTTRILFIFDASNSMAGQWDGERKFDIAPGHPSGDGRQPGAAAQCGDRTACLWPSESGPSPGLQRHQTGGPFQRHQCLPNQAEIKIYHSKRDYSHCTLPGTCTG